MPNVTTTPLNIGASAVLIQNLGPGDLFVGAAAVTSATGVKISAGDSITMGYSSQPTYIVSSATSDARLMYGATGIFDTATPSA